MIEERLIPKVREFFDFEMKQDSTAIDILTYTMCKISKNKMLVMHGCPLHRLMFEMESLDSDIATVCEREFEHLTQGLSKVLKFGMKEGSIKDGDAKELAEFLIASSWGLLSRPVASSSEERFMRDSMLLLDS